MNRNVIFYNKIYNPENLYHAWCKAKQIYDYEIDFVFDRDKLVHFEANLKENLEMLSRKIKQKKYRLSTLIPMALPKDAEDADDENTKRSRQHFYISLEDQIVWIAVVNIIGPVFDAKMPFWSFGNRLYMSIWKDEDEDTGKSEIKFGTYRPSSRKIYRNWSSSWPLFRKAVSITVKEMCKDVPLSQEEEEDKHEYNQNAPKELKIKYWNQNYWKTPNNCDIYYAAIDLKKFYPSIDVEKIFAIEKINSVLYSNRENCEDAKNLHALLQVLLDFQIDEKYIGMDQDYFPHHESDLQGSTFIGIPTGLFVAGFLSNVAMFDVDISMMEKIETTKRVAHFRFVDDHVILAPSVEELKKWIDDYTNILQQKLPRVSLNSDKTQPQELNDYMNCIESEKEDKRRAAGKKCMLDKNLPSPFTTLTIKKMSGLNRAPFELMGEREKLDFIFEIEHVLATEFPEEEIKKGTRVSWASSILGRIVPTVEFDVEKAYEINRKIELTYIELDNANSKPSKSKDAEEQHKAELLEQLEVLKSEQILINGEAKIKEKKLYAHVFSLLMKALNDNISKPKIWKKVIRFCWTTGHNGFDRIIKSLDDDKTLTRSGKSYILSTVLSDISENIISYINTPQQSCNYLEGTNQKRAELCEDLKRNIERIYDLVNKYNSFYSSEILMQFVLSLRYADSETNRKSYFNLGDELDKQISYLWICFSKLNSINRTVPPITWLQLYEFAKDKHILDTDHNQVITKLLLMYPEYLGIQLTDFLMEQKILTKKTFDELNREDIDGYTNLYSWYIVNATSDTPVNRVSFDLLKSEWVALEICKNVIENIKNPIGISSLNELMETHVHKEFYNCHPCNFWISKKIKSKKGSGWEEMKRKFRPRDNKPIIEYHEFFSDIRFQSEYYNEWGIVNDEKKQIYSIGILLLMLLNPSFSFNPLVNRGDAIDKRYYLLLDQLNECNISSYTRAIITGALCYRNFELQHLSFFDQFFSRDKDNANDPISVESIENLLDHIEKAQKVLDKYQLSLENNAPRQLISILLRNLSISYNPYSEREE